MPPRSRGKTYGANHDDDVRLRVVADHVRSGLMLINDGVSPGNEARGYVLRRLLRRVVRSMRLLGVQEPTFAELFPVSRDAMKASYPEVESGLRPDQRHRLLRGGGVPAHPHARAHDVRPRGRHRSGGPARRRWAGDKAFQLHDTYGFPIDLTLEMAAEQGLSVDEAGFRTLMQEQRSRAKADAKAKKGSGVNTEVYTELRALGETPFLGFDTLGSGGTVRGIVVDGELVHSAAPGQEVELILDETPFYPESGGQSGDHGRIFSAEVELDVYDVQRPVKGLIVHKARVESGELRTGLALDAEVDRDWRLGACQAHSATHVIHEALHQILGPTALQAGSYNRPGYMRLDFSWGHGVSDEQRARDREPVEPARSAPTSGSARA